MPALRAMFELLRWHAESLRWMARWQAKAESGGGVVLGRFACLGRDVLEIVDPSRVARNVQKGRGDILLESLNSPERRPIAPIVGPHLVRRDVFPLILEQQVLPWIGVKSRPDYILMDSFAELTDQLFVHRTSGWRFCCHYTDLNHSPDFVRDFECVGLLDPARFEAVYRALFSFFRASYGAVPIVFLHFPTVLDQRAAFGQRAGVIKEVVDHLSNEFAPLHSLAIDDGIVSWPETDSERTFPYHYNAGTYRAFSDRARAVLPA